MQEFTPAEKLAEKEAPPRKRTRLVRWFLGESPERAVSEREPRRQPGRGRIGVSCSGGGIRSAAYNLGALQELQRAKILGRADYVAAVSGGSYIAASYAIVRRHSGKKLLEDPPIYSPGSPEERWLRHHSSYMAPGLGGKVRLILRVLTGLAVNLGMVTLFLYVVARPLGWLYGDVLQQGLSAEVIRDPGNPGSVTIDPWMWWTVGVPAGVAGLLTLIDLVHRWDDNVREVLGAWSIRLLLVGGAAAVVLLALPYLLFLVRDLLAPASEGLGVAEPEQTVKTQGNQLLRLIGGLGVVGVALGALRALVAKRRSLLAMIAGAVIGPLALLALFLFFLNDATFAGWTWQQMGGWWGPEREFAGWGWRMLGGWIPMAFLAAILYASVDLTAWSMHPFYKRRLNSAFALRRVDGSPDQPPRVKEIRYKERLTLSNYRIEGWPELVVCAAANVSDEGATPPGRNATSFTFTPEWIGGPDVGKIETPAFERALGKARQKDATLLAAVAVSGAALSPSMGKMTRGALRFLLALVNVRLGVWLPNPRYVEGLEKELEEGPAVGRAVRRAVRMRPRPLYLVREAFGWHRLRDKFLYISDGGHYENLGLVELLRRGCTKIYCFDASGDREDTFFTLGEAIALARAELGVEIDIDPRALRPNPETGLAQVSHAVGTIHYAEPRPQGTRGQLIFVKATVTEDAPWDVRAFKEKDERFPNHSTVDQLFNEEKFEAYRRLGAHAAARALAAERERLEREKPRVEIRPDAGTPRAPAG